MGERRGGERDRGLLHELSLECGVSFKYLTSFRLKILILVSRNKILEN